MKDPIEVQELLNKCLSKEGPCPFAGKRLFCSDCLFPKRIQELLAPSNQRMLPSTTETFLIDGWFFGKPYAPIFCWLYEVEISSGGYSIQISFELDGTQLNCILGWQSTPTYETPFSVEEFLQKRGVPQNLSQTIINWYLGRLNTERIATEETRQFPNAPSPNIIVRIKKIHTFHLLD